MMLPRLPRMLPVLLCAALLALSACGKRGNPEPPGPRDDIIYPRTYPSR